MVSVHQRPAADTLCPIRGHGRAGGQQELNITERNEIMFVVDFVDGEELRVGMPGPVEFRRGPVNEIAPEDFAFWTE